MPSPSDLERLISQFVDRVLVPKMEEAMDTMFNQRIEGPPPRIRKSTAKAKRSTTTRRPDPRPRPRTTDAGPRTLYDDLEVSPRASQETIKAAYRSLATRYHPDVNKHKEAAERMKQLNKAWEVLGDVEKRREYDRQRREY